MIDPRSTANAKLIVSERADLLVVGAGPAGLAAAIAAAGAGISVVLVDENPVAFETMGDDVPLHFGGRAGGAARNRTAMMEAMLASEPALADAVEAGVDVRLGTIVWGLYANGPSVGWLPGKVAGLSDGVASWMLGFEAAIVASGRRDMGLAFPGWERPGVMGATAAERLATRYGALDARRAVVLGTTTEALLAALALARAGVSVAAVVEQAATPVGPAALLDQLGRLGVPILTRQTIASATGDIDGVTGAMLAALDDQGRRMAERSTLIACDTIVLGVGIVPVIELLDAVGCRTVFSPDRGGHVPVTDAAQATSLPGIYAAGDCAGVWAAKSMDRTFAEAEGRVAASHAVGFVTRLSSHSGTIDPRNAGHSDSMGDAASRPPSTIPPTPTSMAAYRLDWVRSAVVEATGAAEAHVCQCEEVTARDILEVRPPRYLGWDRPRRNRADLAELLGNGAPNPDQVKRLTRAGMGLCQGRRCREQVAALLALGAGAALDEVPLATFRAPVRPMPLGLAGSVPGSAEMEANWHVWFGILDHGIGYQEAEPGTT